MQIYILPVPEDVQPRRQLFRYPSHNADYGVEQEFLRFLEKNPRIVTHSPHSADWHYLPIFWTRWHLNHDYAKWGRNRLQEVVDSAIVDDSRTFTLCQYADGPVVNTGRSTVFLTSRKVPFGIDIPLLSSPHRVPWIVPRKRYLASFVGRLHTHPIRERMAACLAADPAYFIRGKSKSSRYFVRSLLAAHAALCPRGYGGSSYRFFEAMQLGRPPVLLGDLDTRPFHQWIRWDTCSFYIKTPEDIRSILGSVPLSELDRMGEQAARLWHEYFANGRWCELVLLNLAEPGRSPLQHAI